MIRLVVVTMAALFLAGAGAELPPWEKVGDDEGVISFKRPPDSDGVVHFKGEVTIDATTADVMAVMEDNSTASEWMPLVAERVNLKVISPTDHIEYTHMAMPWPATDRYFIDESIVEALPKGGYRLSVESVEPEPAWLKPDMVLATFKKSVALLTPIDGGRKTFLVFEVHSAAGGYLPQWLVGMAQRNWPHDFATGLIKQLTKRGKLGATGDKSH